jgi:hypothetical protein
MLCTTVAPIVPWICAKRGGYAEPSDAKECPKLKPNGAQSYKNPVLLVLFFVQICFSFFLNLDDDEAHQQGFPTGAPYLLE